MYMRGAVHSEPTSLRPGRLAAQVLPHVERFSLSFPSFFPAAAPKRWVFCGAHPASLLLYLVCGQSSRLVDLLLHALKGASNTRKLGSGCGNRAVGAHTHESAVANVRWRVGPTPLAYGNLACVAAGVAAVGTVR